MNAAVETEVNGDSKRTNERGPILDGSWACCAACFALAALVGPVQNIFSRALAYFSSFVPIAFSKGTQPCWVACLSVCVSVHDKSTFSVCALMISSFDCFIGEKLGQMRSIILLKHSVHMP